MQELMDLLERFQLGYSERNLDKAQQFITEMFTEQEPIYYGTSPAEQCVGAGRILRQISYDWSVWGDLKLDFDSLVAHSYGHCADFILTGYVDWEVSEEAFLSRAMMDVKDTILRGGDPKPLLYELSALSSKMLMETARGTRHLLPIRMSGMAVRENGALKLSHIHLSYPTEAYPDSRVVR